MSENPDAKKEQQPPELPLQAAVVPRQGSEGPEAAACRCLLTYWDGKLPVQPRRILQALPGVEVLDWQQTCARLREAGVDPDQVLMDFYGKVGALKIDGERDGSPMTGVCLLPGQLPVEQRFTLAHELGHILLGHACESGDADAEANAFASHLLLPRAVALKLLPRGRLLPGDLPRLARIFGVSPRVIRRAEREGWQYPASFTDVMNRLLERIEIPSEV